jgi:hypothetical protein
MKNAHCAGQIQPATRSFDSSHNTYRLTSL